MSKTPTPASAEALPQTGSKVESIVRHCVYEIGTGSWQVGQKLPSLRQAQERWGVNHLTVLKAYRQLCDLGLVRAATRSGYFVAEQTAGKQVMRAREELDRIYRTVRRQIARLTRNPGSRPGRGSGRGSGPLSELGAFRYLAHLAENAARHQPECAFVECTAFQTSGHAREVERRLAMPCLPWTTDMLAEESPVPSVRSLLTTSFHRAEVSRWARAHDLTVCTVAIELDPGLVQRVADTVQRGIDVQFLATARDLAKDISRDVRRRIGPSPGRFTSAGCTVDHASDVVGERLAGRQNRQLVVSPSLWSAADERWRRDDRVWPLTYRIADMAWQEIGATMGLPVSG